MQTSKYRHAAQCALVGGRINFIARMKGAYWTAHGVVAGKLRLARASAAPRCTRALAHIRRWSAHVADLLRSAREHMVHQLVARALEVGEVSADLDRRGAACRILMWSLVGITALVGLPFGWQYAALPLLGALAFGSAATVFCGAAGELDRREHPQWHR
jgi:hypothetical protein